ncbi:MAG: toxin-antitoxin system HicB family antitoxin [Clostridium sp.]|nr:toxin-antitoxin system HicB family antitoxin [Clostridium sp.]
MKTTKDIEYFKNLPYTRIIQRLNDESGHYFYGRILELDGCQSTGDTVEELYKNLDEALEEYLEVKLEKNLPIPEPESVENYSGKFVVRMPKTLHQKLAIEANQEGVSLNQYALYKLAR